MSLRETDSDGTDAYHPQHPWEQVGHPKYLPPIERSRSNWPPEPAVPVGDSEEYHWKHLPTIPARKPPRERPTFGPGYTW